MEYGSLKHSVGKDTRFVAREQPGFAGKGKDMYKKDQERKRGLKMVKRRTGTWTSRKVHSNQSAFLAFLQNFRPPFDACACIFVLSTAGSTARKGLIFAFCASSPSPPTARRAAPPSASIRATSPDGLGSFRLAQDPDWHTLHAIRRDGTSLQLLPCAARAARRTAEQAKDSWQRGCARCGGAGPRRDAQGKHSGHSTAGTDTQRACITASMRRTGVASRMIEALRSRSCACACGPF
ncbi:uncharacterized protein J3D65DRAFT_627975 [Phyllosticta citribraziliensis]|uniref:Uncharacterized protein n=1 Tax=Phyllosticta citribraziliensis TaxID=989973 RepID=A0ABR1LQH6_9PEZI